MEEGVGDRASERGEGERADACRSICSRVVVVVVVVQGAEAIVSRKGDGPDGVRIR